ncbi:hypothetical protein [Laspinema olomoucense]|nr:hypothetical protein [Laspinema sp. D3c]MCT7994227.1 hypothetical protein [Laspinema sp. D3c]
MPTPTLSYAHPRLGDRRHEPKTRRDRPNRSTSNPADNVGYPTKGDRIDL